MQISRNFALVEEDEALAGSPGYLTWWMQKWVPVVQHLQLGILKEIEDDFFVCLFLFGMQERHTWQALGNIQNSVKELKY